MSLFANFENPLKSSIGNNYDNDGGDIITTKRHLKKLGYFNDDSENPIITAPLNEGIKQYQKDKQIKIDGTINQGPERTAKWLQESLNDRLGTDIDVDSVLGSQTREAIKEAEKQGVLREVNNDLVHKRVTAYESLAESDPSQKTHLKGWLGRAGRFQVPPHPQRRPNVTAQ